MSGIRFSRDTNDRSCGKSCVKKFNGKKYTVCCMRTARHKDNKCEPMMYNAARLDGVCGGCRRKVGELHGYFDKKRGIKCDHAKVMVECAMCYARFPVIGDRVSYVDGKNCVAWTRFDVLMTRYGSVFDVSAFEFVKRVPMLKGMSPICDGCVQTLLEQGVIRCKWTMNPLASLGLR